MTSGTLPTCPSHNSCRRGLHTGTALTVTSLSTAVTAHPTLSRPHAVMYMRAGELPLVSPCNTVSSVWAPSSCQNRSVASTTQSVRSQSVRSVWARWLQAGLFLVCTSQQTTSGQEAGSLNSQYLPKVRHFRIHSVEPFEIRHAAKHQPQHQAGKQLPATHLSPAAEAGTNPAGAPHSHGIQGQLPPLRMWRLPQSGAGRPA